MAFARRDVSVFGGLLLLALALLLPVGLPAQPGGKLEGLWLGQAAFKLTSPGGKVIVLDPILVNNPKTPAEYKNLDKLGHVDLILVTHGHGDHVGDVKDLAAKTKAKVYGPAGLIATLVDL